ncbi:MAG: DEAD-box ATP-dependent RNA helicase CshA [Opitutia bacterium UBA7350]|nr:MAG: DEAD-box ATP-dependent RNA helicase CshA [Opitutae bacterium UBA7350]
MQTTFSDLGLCPELLEGVRRLGFESPSPIQAETIPVALAGRDIVGLSQTGSGKTAAFGLPALNGVDVTRAETQVLVLCPTRELAVQVCEGIHQLGAALSGLTALPVYGGAPMDRQIKALKRGVHVVVGTPGRLMDHMKRGNFKGGSVKMCILDEADRMLDMGFRDDMEIILDALPSERQTMFFSATMNKGVSGLIKAFSRDADQITIERKALTVDTIEQSYYEVRNRSKIEVMCRLLDLEGSPRGIVFCNTKQMVEEACAALVARGYLADHIHGDIPQRTRERVFRKFKAGDLEMLVATDVAARGLDVDDISVVFNYDLPYDPEDYVHRIGRTGRAGRSGKSITFVYGRDIYRLEAIERYIRQHIPRCRIPTQEEVEGHKADKVFDRVRDLLDSGKAGNYGHLVDRLLDTGHTPTDIASGLFHLLQEADKRESETIAEDSEPYNERPHSIGAGKGKHRKHKGGFKHGRKKFEGKATGGKKNFNSSSGGKGRASQRRFKRPNG